MSRQFGRYWRYRFNCTGRIGHRVVGYRCLQQFRALKNLVSEGWSGIEVQLKRRSNLVPNLVATVKGYAEHESSVFER